MLAELPLAVEGSADLRCGGRCSRTAPWPKRHRGTSRSARRPAPAREAYATAKKTFAARAYSWFRLRNFCSVPGRGSEREVCAVSSQVWWRRVSHRNSYSASFPLPALSVSARSIRVRLAAERSRTSPSRLALAVSSPNTISSVPRVPRPAVVSSRCPTCPTRPQLVLRAGHTGAATPSAALAASTACTVAPAAHDAIGGLAHFQHSALAALRSLGERLHKTSESTYNSKIRSLFLCREKSCFPPLPASGHHLPGQQRPLGPPDATRCVL